jgi:sugar (pentulose or hexulose) kinase
VKLYGGGVKIPLWPRLFADAFGIPVQVVQNSDASAIGAALLGGQGAGIFADPLRTAESMLSVTRTVDPDRERAAAYDRLYERYLLLYQAVQPLYK